MTDGPASRPPRAPHGPHSPAPTPAPGQDHAGPPQTGSAPRVDACRHCAEPERGHFQRWTPAVGWHPWTEPTQEQIKARMIARRADRITKETPHA